jgi:hypothetical protein
MIFHLMVTSERVNTAAAARIMATLQLLMPM